ncbi:MAG: bifunctional serine/threonine-protein kinase/formylglycine-generating enzyme family protein [Acidobacteriota bacterium]
MSQLPTAELVSGTIIDGKYRVDSLMGRGGMGKVYRVTHLQLNKIFALKLMTFSVNDTDPSRVMRFKREAEALARIHHPNVVTVTDFGITPEHVPYIVMEFIEGHSLRELLNKHGRLSQQQTIHIVKQICAGLHAAHLQGIIHRDLKPENIMIEQLADETMMVRVLDFGIAKLVQKHDENLTNGEELLGTLKYMSPEQFLGAPIDARADIFGICLITYEMLTGIVAPAVMSLARPVVELRPDTSPRLNNIILMGLSQSPEERPQTALELKRELEVLEHEAVVEAVLEESLGSGEGTQTSKYMAIPTARNRRVVNSIRPEAYNIVEVQRSPSTHRYWLIAATLLLVAGGLIGWRIYPTFNIRLQGETLPKISPTAIPEVIMIRGSKFIMGSNRGDDFAQPEHLVEVEPFQVGRFLVTNRQYAEFVKLGNYRPPSHWQSHTPPNDILEQPVTNVSWRDANSYCNWLTAQTGQAYRLLFEKEWEYLARNSTKFGVNELAKRFNEWTDTEFYLYPGSKIKMGNTANRVRILRGLVGAQGNDQITFRHWAFEDFTNTNLGFRVAYKATGN